MARYDWSKPVNSLIHKLQKAGLIVKAVDDGEEIVRTNTKKQLEGRKIAVEAVTSVDLSEIILENTNGNRAVVYIALGNEVDEIVSDWSHEDGLHDTIGRQLESAIEEYCQQWEGKKCPTVAA